VSYSWSTERWEPRAWLGAADVDLPDDVLDRIDEIVAPGVNVNPPTPGT
jgi:hypothetical protein